MMIYIAEVDRQPDIIGVDDENDYENEYEIKHENHQYDYNITHDDMDEYMNPNEKQDEKE